MNVSTSVYLLIVKNNQASGCTDHWYSSVQSKPKCRGLVPGAPGTYPVIEVIEVEANAASRFKPTRYSLSQSWQPLISVVLGSDRYNLRLENVRETKVVSSYLFANQNEPFWTPAMAI